MAEGSSLLLWLRAPAEGSLYLLAEGSLYLLAEGSIFYFLWLKALYSLYG